MIRIVMSIRPAELIVALLVACGVVVFGSVKQSEASFSSVCASLDWWETSDWFCDDQECRSKTECVGVWDGNELIARVKYKFWKNRQIRIHKNPAIGGCAIADSRCPGWRTSDCGPWGGYSEVIGPCDPDD